MTGATDVRRLGPGDRDLARRLFAMMDDVFEAASEPLGDAYVDTLLGRTSFWAVAALSGNDVVGGLTAHELPMTRAETHELFIYDVAVHAEHRRQGIGRQLLRVLCAEAGIAGIENVFVPVENEDEEALEFYRATGGEPMSVTMFTYASSAAASIR
ncbi:MAG: GNAT family N-acetyltransferase [Gemmatimonadota bacterium]